MRNMAGLMAAIPGVAHGTGPAGGAAARRPNILLIVSDEHRRDACGCHGSPVRTRSGNSPTPHIDSIAAAGVRLDAMYCPAPLCAPSRAAYMTGCHPHTTTALHHQIHGREAGRTRFPGVRGDLRGMGEHFRDAGYRTATIGKVHVHGELADGWDLGFDVRKLRFYTEFPGSDYKDLRGGDLKRRYREMPPFSGQFYRDIDPPRFADAPDGLRVQDNACNQHYLETLIQRDGDMADTMVTDESIAFMRECHAGGQPFFVHVGLEKPHRPWTVPQKYLDRFDPAAMPVPAGAGRWLEQGEHPLVQRWCHSDLQGDDVRRSTAAYYACVSAVDDCVGRLLAACDGLGIREDTVIIYTSDHGDNLFEHGLIEKHNMFEGAVAVPFVMAFPRHIPAGITRDDPASLIDLIPTLAGLAGAGSPRDVEGISLLPAIRGEARGGRVVFSEFYQAGNNSWMDQYTPVRMALNRDYKYVYTHACLDQLFSRDPARFDESVNLALDPAHEEMVSRMRLLALSDWEVDEYPHLSARSEVRQGLVRLEWQAWPGEASYDVYRGASPDPALARRIAAGLPDRTFEERVPGDGRPLYYWIIAHPRMELPFRDRNGRSRFGDLPVKASQHPKLLPVAPCLKVLPADGYARDFHYKPLLGLAAFGRQWIYTGHKPAGGPSTLAGRGPCVLLTEREIAAGAMVSASVGSPRPGPQSTDTVGLVLCYDTCDRYYRALVSTDGAVVLQRRSGKKFAELARAPVPGLRADADNLLQASCRAGVIELRLNGEPVLVHADPDPLPPGRAGYEADLNLPAYRIAGLTVGETA